MSAVRDEADPERLETPKQLAARVGLSKRQVNNLIATGRLEFVEIGCRVYIPRNAWPRFLDEAKRVKPCHDEIKAHGSAGSPSAAATTSPGLNMAGAASAALALQTANKLKQSSRNGSRREGAEPDRVIPLKSS
jgi:excisionase family DNA binding protein